ncbi:16S rRNA (adenine(1518)-N(6)/adenine(1519)-N(6))-dimethyltransferaseRsmA [soil metagenome]
MVRLGQNFLADTNLLDAIVRESEAQAGEVVLEVGGGEGVLSERLAPLVEKLWVIELDEGLRPRLEELAEANPAIELRFGDAMHLDLAGLDPAPTRMVSNLPYGVATPVILKTIAELPSLRSWTVMVQREIADRMRAVPGTKAYGSPSVMVQLACTAKMLRKVDPAVFKPRPRVESAVLRLDRVGEWPGKRVEALVRASFAQRRKTLARSASGAGFASREQILAALESLELAPTVRAEQLEPGVFVELDEAISRVVLGEQEAAGVG